jgi:hypothetical protein
VTTIGDLGRDAQDKRHVAHTKSEERTRNPWRGGPAQPGIAADRFAREIVGFLKASSSALAAADGQTVGRRLVQSRVIRASIRVSLCQAQASLESF